MEQAFIQLRKISKNYSNLSGANAMRQIDFAIAAGEFVAVMGPSGCGKSTLANILGLLDQPSSGQMFLSGENVTACSRETRAMIRASRFGFVFQGYHLLERRNLLQNVCMALEYNGSRGSENTRRARLALSRVGLEGRDKDFPNELSGGEQQRVAIARAMVTNPDVIIADEPTGALDSNSGRNVMQLLQCANRSGCTVVLVTHDENLARQADRMLTMKDGVIESDSRQQNINSALPFAANG